MIGLIALLWYGNVTLIASQVQWQILSNTNVFNLRTLSVPDFSSVFHLLLSCWQMTPDIYLFFYNKQSAILKMLPHFAVSH